MREPRRLGGTRNRKPLGYLEVRILDESNSLVEVFVFILTRVQKRLYVASSRQGRSSWRLRERSRAQLQSKDSHSLLSLGGCNLLTCSLPKEWQADMENNFLRTFSPKS